MSEQSHRERVFERRKRLLLLRFRGVTDLESFERLGAEFGVTGHAILEDWSRRDEWIWQILAEENREKLANLLVGEFDALIEECWSVIRKCSDEERSKGYWNAVTNAIRNARETLVEKGRFLQSIGKLPKTPTVLEQKIEYEEIKPEDVTEMEAETLAKAARILNKKGCSKNKLNSLH